MGASKGDPIFAIGGTMTVPGGDVVRIGTVEKHKELIGYVDCSGFGDGLDPQQIPQGFRHRVKIEGEAVLGGSAAPIAVTLGSNNYLSATCRFSDGETWAGNAWMTTVVMRGKFKEGGRLRCVAFVLFDGTPTITGQLEP